jgi:hypothetical protein
VAAASRKAARDAKEAEVVAKAQQDALARDAAMTAQLEELALRSAFADNVTLKNTADAERNESEAKRLKDLESNLDQKLAAVTVPPPAEAVTAMIPVQVETAGTCASRIGTLLSLDYFLGLEVHVHTQPGMLEHNDDESTILCFDITYSCVDIIILRSACQSLHFLQRLCHQKRLSWMLLPLWPPSHHQQLLQLSPHMLPRPRWSLQRLGRCHMAMMARKLLRWRMMLCHLRNRYVSALC